jgi:hypothetical protein
LPHLFCLIVVDVVVVVIARFQIPSCVVICVHVVVIVVVVPVVVVVVVRVQVLQKKSKHPVGKLLKIENAEFITFITLKNLYEN